MIKGVILSDDAREEFSLASGIVVKQITGRSMAKNGVPRDDYKAIIIKPDEGSGITGKQRATIWRRTRLSTRMFAVCGKTEEGFLLRQIAGRASFIPGDQIFFVPPQESGSITTVVTKGQKFASRERMEPKREEKQVLAQSTPSVRKDNWWDEQS